MIGICRLIRSLPTLRVSIRGETGSKSTPALAVPISVHQVNVASRSKLPFRRISTGAAGESFETSVVSKASSIRDDELSSGAGDVLAAGTRVAGAPADSGIAG